MSDTILWARLVDSLRQNDQVLGHVLRGVSQAQASTWRDGPAGWTILEVVCHLRDYDAIFRERGELMLGQQHPTFPVYDHLAMVVDRAYNQQPLAGVLAALTASREQTITFFAGLDAAQWARTGQHGEHGRYTMQSLAAHISWHDANHLEQITRIMRENRRE
jgi:hypothetical protein